MDVDPTAVLDQSITRAWSLSLSDQPTAIALYAEALKTSQAAGYLRGQGRCLLGLGRIYCFRHSISESMEKLEQALPILTGIEDHVGVAYVHSYTAVNYLYLPVPLYQNAHDFMQRALQMAEKSGDPEAIGRILLNLGEVFQEWGRIEDALATYKRRLAHAEKHNDLEGIHFAHGYIGKVLQDLKRDDEAILELERSVEGFKELGRAFMHVEMLCSLGKSLMNRGRLPEARTRFEEALAVGDPIEERSHTTSALMALARMDTEAGDMDSAEERLRRALENAEILKAPEWKHRALEALTELAEQKGDFTAALAWYKQFHAIYLSIEENSLTEKARAKDYELKLQKEKDEIEAKHRGSQIRSLVLPMIASIERTGQAIEKKMGAIARLSELADESHRKLETSNAIISRVSSDVDQMVGMVDMINEISATVNLLALNAKIESAHAGHFGKGFSVIAGEIGKLSDTTQAQAEGIAKTLDAVIEGARHSSVASREGFATFQSMDQAMSEVRTFLQELSGRMANLTASSMGILEVMQETAGKTQP